MSFGSRKDKRKNLGILFTFWCMVWKERNRGIFEDKHLSGLQVAHLIKEDILLFNSLPSF
jgi:hypothetical protein